MATYERDSDSTGRMEVWRYNHVTGSGAATFAEVTIPNVHGMLARVTWAPGGTTPDSTTGLTIKDAEGVDALNGDGASLDMTAVGHCHPEDENSNAIMTPVTGALTVALTNNSTNDASVEIAVYIIRFPR